MKIESISDFRVAMRSGPYAWPGGYPLYFVLADGGALAFKTAQDRFVRREMLESLARPQRSDQWRPVAIEVNWEDSDLRCDHTSERIESAYNEDSTEQEN